MGQVDDTFGAWYIGSQVATVCFGLFVLQVWLYLQRWQSEPWYLKAFVLSLLVLNLFQIICATAGLYHFLITGIANPAALMDLPWGLLADPWITGVIVASTQFFYALRLFFLNRSYTLFITICVLDLTALICGWVAAGLETALHGALIAPDLTKALALTALACDALNDILIMIGMFHFFHQSKKLTTFARTQYILTSLVTYSFATGLATSVGAILTLAVHGKFRLFQHFIISLTVFIEQYLGSPNTQIFSGISFVLPHLYSNSVLSLLNVRNNIRERSAEASTQQKSATGQASTTLKFNRRVDVHTTTSFGPETEQEFARYSRETSTLPLEDLGKQHDLTAETNSDHKYPAL